MSVDQMLKSIEVTKQPYKMRHDIKVGDIIQQWVERTGLWGWFVNYRFLNGTGDYQDVGKVVESEECKRRWGNPPFQDMTPEEADRRIGFVRVIRIVAEPEGP